VVGGVILLLGCWFIWMNYRVDKEKEDFKANPDCKIWGKKAEYIAPFHHSVVKGVDPQNPGINPEEGKKSSKLLVSGWWGKSRHMNYTYEIGLSGCWSAVGAPLGIAPFAYLGYIIALLVHRIYRDEDKCRVKYGKYWDEYCKRVPARLIPGIF
jgi:7-dehydrocholesterol reductase